MTELLTAAQMRAIEQDAMASGAVTGLELMERAGRGVVDAILDWRPELATTSHRAVILCGPGNNGGDGFVVARLLRDRGWEVDAFLLGEEANLPSDAAENARRWRDIGGRIQPLSAEIECSRCDLLVDAIFGTGVSRPLDGSIAELARRSHNLSESQLRVCVDLPSGVCSDSGRILGVAFAGDLTVTFHRPKLGHVLDAGPGRSGCLRLLDIGLTDAVAGAVRRVERPPPLGKGSPDHKYSHGHTLVLAGGVGKGGAARLAARGALRIGAGLVTVGCPPAAVIENAARLDAIMLRSVADADALSALLEDARLNALCLGPGLGVGHTTRERVAAALSAQRGTVLDADALTSFAGDPSELLGQLHGACVLTPHEGEFGRLFPDLLAKLKEPAAHGPAYSKVDATRDAAARAGCIVLFKGADTVIADPSGRCSINAAQYERAAPWLATAGSGDVLAGFITGLLARGVDPMGAAEAAAWLHVACALSFGPGLIAEDLPEQLPAVFRDLGL